MNEFVTIGTLIALILVVILIVLGKANQKHDRPWGSMCKETIDKDGNKVTLCAHRALDVRESMNGPENGLKGSLENVVKGAEDFFQDLNNIEGTRTERLNFQGPCFVEDLERDVAIKGWLNERYPNVVRSVEFIRKQGDISSYKVEFQDGGMRTLFAKFDECRLLQASFQTA